jgi:hypothetical protein
LPGMAEKMPEAMGFAGEKRRLKPWFLLPM